MLLAASSFRKRVKFKPRGLPVAQAGLCNFILPDVTPVKNKSEKIALKPNLSAKTLAFFRESDKEFYK